MKYLGLSITELHNLLISGKVTPEELANEAILACKSDTNNAFEYICENEIKKQLEELNNKDKNDLFWGIPFTAKDNFSTKDIPTCGSSNILNGYKPLFNATVIDKLVNRGAILIAKTTMDELAITYNDISCLENYHTSKLFSILRKDNTNIFANSPRETGFVKSSVSSSAPEFPAAESVSYVLFTTGTTGMPKAWRLAAVWSSLE